MKLIVEPLLNNMKKYNPGMSEAQLRTRRYGLESLISDFSKTLIYLILFSIFRVTLPFVVSFVVYGFIRSFTGGYHANSYWSCFFVSLAGFVLTVGSGLYIEISNVVCLVILIIAAVIDIAVAPVSHPNKPNKDPVKRKKFKVISCIIILVFGGSAFLFTAQYRITIITSIALVTIMQLLGIRFNNLQSRNNIVGV